MLKYLKNVATLRLDVEVCNGCGMCTNVCPHGVFQLNDRKARIVDLDACMECGACVNNCPVNAIQVNTGVGCASGILMGAIGKGGECSCSCGVSPAVAKSNQTTCCGTTTENPKAKNGTSCCNNKS
jgi:NAD-dependent dihydropyrimidine dehydrogenase PreA subunit